jgi:lipopolysaccharide export system ATP-binding protein
MSLSTEGEFVVHAKSSGLAFSNGAGWFGRLRGLFARKAQRVPAKSAEWLLAEASETVPIPKRSQKTLENWHDEEAELQRLQATPSSAREQAVHSQLHEPKSVRRTQGSLIAESLSKSFKGRKVVRDVSLRVHRGEAIGLLGPNGAGKTTLFYMITGLIRPDAGSILLDDYEVTKLPMYRRARLGIGYLPQEPSIFRGLSVEANIRAVLEITQPDKNKRREELESLLAEFDITRLRKLPSIALSGGERRRCEIARALAGHPSFILLDEPFAGIDPIAIGEIRLLVQHLKRRGIGVLITDHNVRETLDLIDRAYILHSGQVLIEGTPEKIVADTDVRRLYLGETFRL